MTNPFGLPIAWKGLVEGVTGWAGMIVVLGGFLGVLALVLRYRRSTGEERQQIRWLAYAGQHHPEHDKFCAPCQESPDA